MIESSTVTLRQSRRIELRALTADFNTIIVVRDGSKRVRRDAQAFELTPTCIGVLEAGASYTIENRPPKGRSYVASALLVSHQTIRQLQAEGLRSGSPFATTQDDRARAAYERAAAALSDPLLPPQLRENAVREVLLWLGEFGVGFPLRPHSFVERLRSCITAEADIAWTAADAGRALAVSEATLRRRLADAGTSFQDLLADVRMTQALGLLQTTHLSINRIALEVGYASPSRFAARFRARFGVRPSEVRSPQIDHFGT